MIIDKSPKYGCHFSLAPMVILLANISVYCWVQIKLFSVVVVDDALVRVEL